MLSNSPDKTKFVTFFSGRRTRIISLLGLSAALIVAIALATSTGSVTIPLALRQYMAGRKRIEKPT